ncbi:MAG TPA: ankyrin repeat domain-containing protein [Reyranella sp.]|nr:ankyrin repeat domain-containing protein [Reyranella sp.]
MRLHHWSFASIGWRRPFGGQLSDAVVAENYELIEALFQKGARVNARDEDGLTPLILACMVGAEGAAFSLLKHGAKVNARTSFGSTALMEACGPRATWRIAEDLLEMGADPNARRDDGMTALMLASFYGKKHTVRDLLRHGAEVHAKDNKAKTALHHAYEQTGRPLDRLSLEFDHFEVVERLLSKGASLDVEPSDAMKTARLDSECSPRITEPPSAKTMVGRGPACTGCGAHKPILSGLLWRKLPHASRTDSYCQKCGRCYACERRIPMVRLGSWRTSGGTPICPSKSCRLDERETKHVALPERSNWNAQKHSYDIHHGPGAWEREQSRRRGGRI